MKIKHLTVLALTSTLVACGGSESDTPEVTPQVTQTENAARTYTGYRNPAKLTAENSFEYIEQVFVGASSNILAKASRELPSQSALTIFSIQTALSSIASATTRFKYPARRVNATESCSHSGSITLTGDIDNMTNTGTLNADMSHCDQGNGVINGELTMHVERVSDAEQLQAYTLSFDDISLSAAGQSYTLSGSQSYNSSNGVEATVSNILQITPENRQILTEDFAVVDNTLEHLYTETSASSAGLEISGKIYISDYGYVDLYTDDRFKELSTEVLPYSGSMDLAGDSSSVRIKSDFDFTNVHLDEDGNGIHELFYQINNDVGLVAAPTFIDTPPPVINLEQVMVGSTPLVGFSVDFLAFLSYDPNDSELTYEWTLTDKPEGSLATIEYFGDSTASISLTPDIAGDYTIQLTLTNANGFSSTEEVTFTAEEGSF